jgi:hypothetical protein
MSFEVAKKFFLRWQERTREPSLTALLMVEVALIFVVVPLVAFGLAPFGVLTMMVVLFVMASLVVASQSRMAMIVLTASIALNQVAVFIDEAHPSALTQWLGGGASHIAICAVSWVIVKAVFGPGRVTAYRIQAAMVLYLNLALFFFTLYRLLMALAPNAFQGIPYETNSALPAADLLYFSFVVLANISNVDITSLRPIVRTLVTLESVIGLLYPAMLLVGFVSLKFEHWTRRT